MKRLFSLLIVAFFGLFSAHAQVVQPNYIEAELSDTPDTDYIYQLPYSVGTKATAVSISAIEAKHLPPDNLMDFRAFEFRFKKPTDVCAVRSGKVLLAEMPKVRIQHADGTVAEYAAFAEGSICVEVGDEVTTGQKIGTSGKSLFSEAENVITFELYHRKSNTSQAPRLRGYAVLNHYLDPLFRSQRGVKPLQDMKRYKAKRVN